jgi:hypothetical protein
MKFRLLVKTVFEHKPVLRAALCPIPLVAPVMMIVCSESGFSLNCMISLPGS